MRIDAFVGGEGDGGAFGPADDGAVSRSSPSISERIAPLCGLITLNASNRLSRIWAMMIQPRTRLVRCPLLSAGRATQHKQEHTVLALGLRYGRVFHQLAVEHQSLGLNI